MSQNHPDTTYVAYCSYLPLVQIKIERWAAVRALLARCTSDMTRHKHHHRWRRTCLSPFFVVVVVCVVGIGILFKIVHRNASMPLAVRDQTGNKKFLICGGYYTFFDTKLYCRQKCIHCVGCIDVSDLCDKVAK